MIPDTQVIAIQHNILNTRLDRLAAQLPSRRVVEVKCDSSDTKSQWNQFDKWKDRHW